MATEALQPEPTTSPLEKGGWFGPIFFWDLIRESRKGSSYLPRMVYAGGLLLVLYLVMGRGVITQNRIAGLCYEAFRYYLILQYVAILALTPVYVAGALIEERQQRTLSLLLTTYLTPREIVLGKMMSRLVPMLGILLAGVPVLAILQLLGGISFEWLILHSLIALALLFTVGMHAIRASTVCKTVGGAVVSTYFSILGSTMILLPFLAALVSSGTIAGIVISVIILLVGYLAFSMFALFMAIGSIASRDRDQDFALSEMQRGEQLPTYVHPPVPLPPSRQAEKESEPDLDIPQRIERFIKPNPAGDRPIIWKESYFPSPELLNILALLFCAIPIMIFLAHVLSPKKDLGEISSAMGFYIGYAYAFLGILLILITLRAAGTVVTERKQQTLVSLLTTPLSWNQVLLEFYLGSFCRYRWLALGTLLISICAALFDPENIVTVLLVYITQLAFFAMVGLAASLVFQTAFQARLMLCVFFLTIFMILPSFRLVPHTSIIRVHEMLLAPYRFWLDEPRAMITRQVLMPEQLTITSLFLSLVFLLVNLAMIWALTWLLFCFSRYRLRRLMDRGLS